MSPCVTVFPQSEDESRTKVKEEVRKALAEMPLIEAMGGELEIIAKFPDGAVKINTFAKI
jgi:hypothetical protein